MTVGEAVGVSSRSEDEYLGRLHIHDRVVEKIAARAAREIAEAGSAAPRVLGRTLPWSGRLGTRSADLDAPPKASVEVEGSVSRIELSIGVRWPASIPDVAARVRDQVRTRVSHLTGLHVQEVEITVDDLILNQAPRARVR
ncbi:Asp23/Gls24 family envelope stress response protein [Micromonospora sp. NPDC049366]|uniref:Asp23/Gls24 family envelope stress response protein n=1 Tax=Micromonospora sp. NPDC049366 TaxID=3364271 RepID=UPI003792863C